ncbi:MAG: 1,6-anhydro-N-acetylmuramyl-L-alanine amidase AmpD [Gammaproteobacteria bacterium]|nr:1,6-anhydro-N-acetylmuramyl-L-alanine amidase AmpD [Gammaproteobacteria bacterium]MDH3767636.1 1,6-anhydro-N-acetylmuramyl-L-alanine amidase AmpD [Gammaproteobacteria bacterium]
MSVVIDNATGLVRHARQVASPNYDARPEACGPNLIVVHAISLPPGEYGGPWIDHLFCNRLDATGHPYFAEIACLRVSAHMLIRRDGELVQYVPLNQRAWHAGESSYEGRQACNDYSIGIELEGDDDTAYTDAQYTMLSAVCIALEQAFPDIQRDRIVGHCDISAGRKTDPGPLFDWDRLTGLLQASNSARC